MVTEMSYMTQILSKTADHKDRHNSAVQLSRDKESIWGGSFSLSFRCLHLKLFLWTTLADEYK